MSLPALRSLVKHKESRNTRDKSMIWPKTLRRLHYHSTGSGVTAICLEPSERKLLTPPSPAPPLKKVISSSRG